MDAQKIAQRLYESFASDDLCEHPEIVDDVEDLADEYEDTKAENDKLRELVHDLRMQLSNAYDNKELEEFDERMQELGIEVQE